MISAAYPPNKGGVATHVANLAHGLLRRDNSYVYVLTSREDTQRPTRTIYRNDRLTVWKMDVKNVANFSGRRAPFEDLLGFVLPKWRDIRPDIIHAHDLDSVQIGCTLKAGFGTPLVATMHRAPNPWRRERFAEEPKDCYVEAIRFYRFADAVVVPSRASRDVLVDQGFKKSKIHIVPHGVGIKYLTSFRSLPELLRSLRLAPDVQLVLCPVRADTHKDPSTFVRAASILRKQAGPGKLMFLLTCDRTDVEYQGLHALAMSGGLHVGKDILFRSFERNEMPTLYRRSAVCVVPSRRESFGQTVLEAFVFRAPVVAANTSSLKEIVSNRRNGLLFTDGNPEDLANQISRVLSSESLADGLRVGGLRSVTRSYDAARMVSRYENLYRQTTRSTKRKVPQK